MRWILMAVTVWTVASFLVAWLLGRLLGGRDRAPRRLQPAGQPSRRPEVVRSVNDVVMTVSWPDQRIPERTPLVAAGSAR